MPFPIKSDRVSLGLTGIRLFPFHIVIGRYLPSFPLLVLAVATAAPVPPVDTWDRTAVRDLYRSYYNVPAVASGWTGNHAGLDPGTTSPQFRDAINTRMNFYRALAGVPGDVVFTDEFNVRAQAAAFVMSRNNLSTHFPPSTSLGWSQDAAIGALRSSLYLGIGGVRSVDGYIQDYGPNNVSVGHRTSILTVPVRAGGVGEVDGRLPYLVANALYTSPSAPSPLFRPRTRETFVAWPHPGHNMLPTLLPFRFNEPLRWSFVYLNARTAAQFANATVAVTRNGQPMRVTIIERRAATGDGVGLVFSVAEMNGSSLFMNDVRPMDIGAPFDVTIDNLQGLPTSRVNYTVVVFNPDIVSAAETAISANPRTIYTRAGVPFSYAAKGTGYTFSAGNLPAEVSIDPQTGVISGQIDAGGSHNAVLTIRNAAGRDSRQLTMVATAPTGATRLSNLSLRSNTTPDARIATAGFVIAGGKKTILARLAGPSLSQFGVEGALAAPRLILYDSKSNVIQSSQAWSSSSDPAGMAQASDFVGAFPFADGSTDSIMVFTLDPGAYTLQSIGVNEVSGVGLIELYDIDQGAGSLTNLSARANVGSGSELLIVGLTVSGTQPKSYLIRATGPGLTAFNVSGALADPILSLIDSAGRTVASNDNWTTNAAAVNAANAQVGAFGQRANSLDSALVVSLPPGGYTVQVAGANGATGVALAEAFELPAR